MRRLASAAHRASRITLQFHGAHIHVQRIEQHAGGAVVHGLGAEGAQSWPADLVIASDGLNSRIRSRYAHTYQPDIDTRLCRFVWLGTHRKFDAFTFAFEQTEHGWFQAHAYQFDADTSTFIVETPQEVWDAHGLEHMSQEEGVAFCEKLLADTGLAIAPGVDFDTVRGSTHVRLSFAGPSSDIDEALRRLGPWLSR